MNFSRSLEVFCVRVCLPQEVVDLDQLPLGDGFLPFRHFVKVLAPCLDELVPFGPCPAIARTQVGKDPASLSHMHGLFTPARTVCA